MSLTAIEAILHVDKERGPLQEAYASRHGDMLIVAYKPPGYSWRRVYVYEFSEGIASGYSNSVEALDVLLSYGEWQHVVFERPTVTLSYRTVGGEVITVEEGWTHV